ncbi:MAG: SGNH/GDSL hydrolase family protein [Ruminococcaceae bacterium]|nr:SGNH/GDSL hydrolase family protein [Oscillospiraceae bacterium]
MKLKKITAIMLASALLLTAAACSSNNDGSSDDTSAATPANTGSDTAGGENTANTEDNSNNGEGAEKTPSDIGIISDNDNPPTVGNNNDYSYADGVEDSEYSLGGALTDRMVALSELNLGNQVRLANVMKKAEAGEEITVAYIGGSITQGSSAGDDGCYARLVTNWFQDTFTGAKINYCRAGIGATGSYIGVHRVQRDVLSNNPDIVFVEFSVNDTTENTMRNVNSYDSLLRKIWSSDSAPAVVCIGMTQDNGTSFQNYHFDIAKSYDLPFISYRNAILEVIDKGYIKWTDISDDNIHPNTMGHKVLTDIVTHYLASVNENKDSISGGESDFSTPYTKDKFADADLITPANSDAEDPTGKIAAKDDTNFGNFIGCWTARGSNLFDGEETCLVFENVEAKNIGLLFGKVTGGGTVLDVYIDDVLVETVDTRFPGGWGNYAEAAEIASFAETGTHTVKIIPENIEGASLIYISGLLVS